MTDGMNTDLRDHIARIVGDREVADRLMPVVDAWARAYAARELRNLGSELGWPDPRGMWRASDLIRKRAEEVETR